MNTQLLLEYQRRAQQINKDIYREIRVEGFSTRGSGKDCVITRGTTGKKSGRDFKEDIKHLFACFEDVVREWNINQALQEPQQMQGYLEIFKSDVYRIFKDLRVFGYETQNGEYIDFPSLEEMKKKGTTNFWMQGLFCKYLPFLNKPTSIYQYSFGFCYVLHDNIDYLEKLHGKLTPPEPSTVHHSNSESPLHSILKDDGGKSLRVCMRLFRYVDIIDINGTCKLGQKMCGKLVAAIEQILLKGLLNNEQKYTLENTYPIFQRHLGVSYSGDPHDSKDTEKYKTAKADAIDFFNLLESKAIIVP